MENKEYLNEEQYQKNSTKVKKVGKTLLIIGIVLLAIGILLIVLGGLGVGKTAIGGIDNADSIKETAGGVLGSFGLFAIGGFINFVGFGLTGAGGIIMFIAHRREITAYTIQQTMPIAKEGIEKMTPTISNAAGTIAESVTKGIKEGLKDEEK